MNHKDLKAAHDYLGKHEWTPMSAQHLHKVMALAGQIIAADTLVHPMGLSLHCCACGAMRITDKEGRELRMDI